MKRILLSLLLIMALGTTCSAQNVAIPDSNFGSWLYASGYAPCLTGNSTIGWQLDTTCSAVIHTTFLDLTYTSVSNYEGIQYFRNLDTLITSIAVPDTLPALPRNLKYLDVSPSGFTTLPHLPSTLLYLITRSVSSLPTLPTSLIYLDCAFNSNLTTLPALPHGLKHLDCQSSFNIASSFPTTLPSSLQYLNVQFLALSSLPALPSTLKYLDCEFCGITHLPTLPASLKYLNCSNNMGFLTTLPTLPSSLDTLSIANNQMTVFPTLPAALKYLDVSLNNFANIPSLPGSLLALWATNLTISSLPSLPTTLIDLHIDATNITSLPLLPNGFKYLSANGSLLTSLPTLPDSLKWIFCNQCHLSSLPLMPEGMLQLRLQNNQLTSLPPFPHSLTAIELNGNTSLSCLPGALNEDMLELKIAGTQIRCMPNIINTGGCYGCDVAISSMPICANGSGCPFYYNISGNAHIDTSSTCTVDSLHNGKTLNAIKVQLRTGNQLLKQVYTTTGYGQFAFKTDSIQNYTVSIDTSGLPFILVCPNNATRAENETSSDTLFDHQDFGLRCRGVDNGVRNISSRFSPGHQAKITIGAGDMAAYYGGICSNGSSGTVTTTFSGPIHYLNPAPGALTASIAGNTLSYTVADFDNIHNGDFDIVVMTDSSATWGSTVCVTTVVHTNGNMDIDMSNDSLAHCFIVTNSHDPNLKTAFPISTVDTGHQWLTYTVNFQNTGTDTAYTIVIKDTLSAYLDASTFQYLASSHNALVQLFGNAMEFTFPKINLIDSGQNEPLSHGWIQYKVKTVPNLSLGTQIQNTASIYFDLNPAIVTNTVTNTVRSCSPSYDTIARSICSGDSVIFGGMPYNWDGIYNDTLQNSTGCDSIVTLHLTVIQTSYTTFAHSICASDSFAFAGAYYHTAGYYSQTYTSSRGCDSVVILHLLVRPLSYDTISQSICQGDSFALAGQYYHTAGYYQASGTSANGCDSITTLHLTILPLSSDTLHQGICAGDSLAWAGSYYQAPGLYTAHYTGSNGCDSSSSLLLTVWPQSYDTISRSICSGDSVRVGTHIYQSSGTHTDTLLTMHGCDSIVTLYLTVRPLRYDTISQSICSGDTLHFHGTNYTTAGYYTHTLTGAGGCDSIASTLHLTVHSRPVVSWTPTDTNVTVWSLCFQWVHHPVLTGAIPGGGRYSGVYVAGDSITYPINHCGDIFFDTIFAIVYTYTDSNGCSNSVSRNFKYLEYSEGITEIVPSQLIRLYPNPNSGSFTLETSQQIGAEYQIYDMLGQLIQQRPISADKEPIYVGGVAPGVYTISIKGRSGSVRFTIMR